MSICSINCYCLGFVFVFVIVTSPNICCVDETLNDAGDGGGRLSDGSGGGSWTGLKLVGGNGMVEVAVVEVVLALAGWSY